MKSKDCNNPTSKTVTILIYFFSTPPTKLLIPFQASPRALVPLLSEGSLVMNQTTAPKTRMMVINSVVPVVHQEKMSYGPLHNFSEEPKM